MKTQKSILAPVVLLALLVYIGYAGDLQPPGPPGSTMKTLDEVEPRIPIPASDTPVAPFTISKSGSYYLIGERLCSGIGIQVNADDVTIDLMGYTLKGPDSGTNYGILMEKRKNVEIRNGTVRDFNIGICEPNSLGKNHRIISVRTISNRISGILLYGSSLLVKDCTATENGTSASGDVFGIAVDSGSTVTGNTVRDNGDSASGVVGIVAGMGSTVTDNTVSSNGGSAGGDLFGIFVDKGSTVTGNTVRDNGDSASGIFCGIYVLEGSTVTGNTVSDNGDGATSACGILVRYGSTVIGNTVYDNGGSAVGDVYGISLKGYNLVDQNTAYDNGLGAGGSVTNMTLGVTGCVYGNNVAP